MNKLTAFYGLAILAAAVTAPLHAQQYNDRKIWSGSVCTPYTSSAPDYSALKFRADGVANQSNSYQYVICALTRDAENTWGYGGDNGTAFIFTYFRANTTGTDQCTLTVGTTANGSVSETKSTAGVVGETTIVAFSNVVAEHAEAPATLVCRIAPKHTLSYVSQMEFNVRTDTYVAP